MLINPHPGYTTAQQGGKTPPKHSPVGCTIPQRQKEMLMGLPWVVPFQGMGGRWGNAHPNTLLGSTIPQRGGRNADSPSKLYHSTIREEIACYTLPWVIP